MMPIYRSISVYQINPSDLKFFYKIFIFICVAKPLEPEPVVKKIAELRPEKHREFALSKGMDSRRLVNIRFDQFSWKIGPRGSFHSEGLS